MKRLSLLVAVLAVGCSDSSSPAHPPDASEARVGGGAKASSAVVRFGRDDVGSPFPPPTGHDRSFHAIDNISPQNVNLPAGGTVTFEMGTFHQVAIYAPGKTPDDVDLSQLENLYVPSPPAPAPDTEIAIPDFIIADADGRIARSPFSFFGPDTWESPAGTFDEPGRYLVICTVIVHFVEAKMYAWVTVR